MLFPHTETSCVGFGNYSKSPTPGSGYFFFVLGAGKSLSQAAKRDRNLYRCVYNALFLVKLFDFPFPNRMDVCYTVVGGMAEWTIAAVLKTAGLTAPGVRIPLPPLWQ